MKIAVIKTSRDPSDITERIHSVRGLSGCFLGTTVTLKFAPVVCESLLIWHKMLKWKTPGVFGASPEIV